MRLSVYKVERDMSNNTGNKGSGKRPSPPVPPQPKGPPTGRPGEDTRGPKPPLKEDKSFPTPTKE